MFASTLLDIFETVAKESRPLLGILGFREGEVFQLAAIRDRHFEVACFRAGPDATFPREARTWVEQRVGRAGLYVCGNPLKTILPSKARAEDVASARALLLDLDPEKAPDDPSGTSPGKRAACRAAALEMQAHVEARTGVRVTLVDSGRGTQVWIKHSPDVAQEERRALSRGLAARFAREGVRFDGTHNVDRLFRLPGTVNLKTRERAEVLDEGQGELTREVMQALLKDLPTVADGADAGECPADFGTPTDEEMVFVQGKAKELWDRPVEKGDRSKRDFSFVLEALRNGATEGAACRLLWAMPRSKAREDRRGENYWISTIKSVRRVLAEKHEAPSKRTKPVLVRLSTIPPEKIEFRWGTRLAVGKLAILEGDPGKGKTFIALDLAARFSTGEPFPGETTRREPTDVIFLNAEDGVADTIRTRLDRLKADVSRIHVLTQGHITLGDVETLDAMLDDTRAGLVVVDPIQAYMPRDVSMNAAEEVRPIMTGLAQLAAKHRTVVVILRHLTKSSASKAAYKGLGSIDFLAAVRSTVRVHEDRASGQRSLVHIKINVAAPSPALGFAVDEQGFRWTGAIDVTTADVDEQDADDGRQVSAERRAKRKGAEEFLRAALAKGPKPHATVLAEAKGQGITEATLDRAAGAMGVLKKQSRATKDVKRHWTWALPGPQAGKPVGGAGVTP